MSTVGVVSTKGEVSTLSILYPASTTGVVSSTGVDCKLDKSYPVSA